MGIEGRVGRIERRLGIDADEDRPFVLEVASGERFTTTGRQLRQIIEDNRAVVLSCRSSIYSVRPRRRFQ